MKRSCWVMVGILFWTVAVAEPVRTLPAPPGKILDLRANAAGDLYVRTETKVLRMDLPHPEEGWNALALDGVVDLTENAGREVFARQDLETRFAFYRLAGTEAVRVATTPHVPCERWYVDAVGRVWAQTKERLLVVGGDRTLLDIPARESRYRSVPFQPCEWKPGHLVLFFATDIVWASPAAVRAEAAHQPFAERPPTSRPLKLGSGKLAIGARHGGTGSSIGRGLYYLLDPEAPDKPPEAVKSDWMWFTGIASAPDGRLLVLTENSRAYTPSELGLFWLAGDWRERTAITMSDAAMGAWSDRKESVLFTSGNLGFAVARNGMLVMFGPREMSLLTPMSGLPVQRIEHAAAVGDDLVLAGHGQIAVWRTTEPLEPAGGFDDRREWPLTAGGPCCARDADGRMWAFLRDFPGKLSRHDGERWQHVDIELGARIAREMTADDKGRLQIAFGDAPSGSRL